VDPKFFGKFVHPWNKASQQTLQIRKKKKIMVCDQIISGGWPHPFRANVHLYDQVFRKYIISE